MRNNKSQSSPNSKRAKHGGPAKRPHASSPLTARTVSSPQSFTDAPKLGRGNPRPLQDEASKMGARIVTGFHACAEALKVRPKDIDRLFLKKGFQSDSSLKELYHKALSHQVPVEEKTEDFFANYAKTHQGILLLARAKPELNWEKLLTQPRACVVFLDGVEDPHNLGAVLRTAWLMGADAIFIPEDRSAKLSASVHKVASGGVEHVPLVTVPSFQPALKKLKENGFWVFGLGAESAKPMFSLKIPEKIVWVLGSEESGMRSTTQRECDEIVSIPQTSNAASYNVSVVVGMVLLETKRQQK